MSERPSLAVAIKRVLRNSLAGVFCARPAIIQSYDASDQTATIVPAATFDVETVDGVESKTPARIEKVPVFVMGGGGGFVSFPIAEGDECLAIFADQSIDQWWQNGGTREPLDLRRHDVNDAIALVGIRSVPNVLDDAHGSNIVIGFDGGSQMMITPSGDVTIGSGSANEDFLARGSYIEDLRDAISGWTPVAQDGGAALKTALTTWLAQTGATVRTTKTKAD